ncbi:MAG: hypothetical protein K6D03_04685 [Solobacterium sp.]|nr:hypothetical protein [Solobacterium sp.]
MKESEFVHLYEQLHDTVYRIAFSYLKNTADAKDAVQDVMLRLYRYEGTFSDEDHCRKRKQPSALIFWIRQTKPVCVKDSWCIIIRCLSGTGKTKAGSAA